MSEILATPSAADKRDPKDIAKSEGKTVICRFMGPMVMVYYPYRTSPDLYVAGPEPGTSHCCQCDVDLTKETFLSHVIGDNKQLKKFPDVIIDKSLVEPVEAKP